MGGRPQALGASMLTPSCQATPGVFASLAERLANTFIILRLRSSYWPLCSPCVGPEGNKRVPYEVRPDQLLCECSATGVSPGTNDDGVRENWGLLLTCDCRIDRHSAVW